MTIFVYRALGSSHEVKSGSIEASSISDATAALAQNGLVPITIQERSLLSRIWVSINSDISLKRQEASGHQIAFARSLQMLLEAHIPVTKAISVLASAGQKGQSKSYADALLPHLRSGVSLADALSRAKIKFSPVLEALISAGEQAGRLPQSLATAVRTLQKIDDSKRKLRAALTYPFILGIVTVGSLFFLFYFAIPNLRELIEANNAEPPTLTVLIFFLSDFVKNNAVILASATAGFVAVVLIAWRTRFRRSLEQFLFRVPILGKLLHLQNASNFCNLIVCYLEASFTMDRIFSRIAPHQNSVLFREFAIEAESKIREGESFTTTLSGRDDILPRSIVEMIEIGDSTGNLVPTLAKAADIMEIELEDRRAFIANAATPFFLVFLGLIVMVVLLSTWTTILSINESIL